MPPRSGIGRRTDYVDAMAAVPRRLTFGAHADEYERARPAWPEDAARWLVPEDAQLVVELGAGTGKLTRAVGALGARVVAVEPDVRMLAVLQGLGLEGVEGSAESIPFDAGVADAVVAGSSFHWFELEPALREIHRVLRPGARLGFGWNHRDDRHPAIARMGEAVYAAQARTRGPRWRSRDWPADIVTGGLFRDVEQELFEHVHELPREALEDHLLSYSGVARLPEDERGRVLAEVGEVLDADASVSDGDRLRLPFVVAAYRAMRVD
jgi:SAM-dependent methyltransferase